MKSRLCALIVVLVSIPVVSQVASHRSTVTSSADASLPSATMSPKPTGKVVARVNGSMLIDRDLVREMYLMFPYAQQHNGFPKNMEPEIRRGALQMLIFEELLYQEALKRKMTVPAPKILKAEKELRQQFATEAAYKQFLHEEVNGDMAELRKKIRRSYLIEIMLRTEINDKAVITPAQVRAYYTRNPDKFRQPETLHFQSISIIPPNATPAVLKEAKTRAEEAVKQAKATKNYREFGLLAEKMSDDDYRVRMGDRRAVEPKQLPIEIIKAANSLKPGEVSDLIRLGDAYTIIRLVEHKSAGMIPFEEVKQKIQSDLQNEKVEQLRSALGKKLRAKAKIEVL